MSVAAGAEVVRRVDVVATPLDVAEILAVVSDPQAGGTDVFVGAVRDHDGGRGVTGLTYTAHPSAVAELDRVCREVAARHEVLALAAVHRVGDLAIGDLAVVVATSAAHRDVCFAATRDLIDTLKQQVPIWKEQTFVDGDVEWVATP